LERSVLAGPGVTETGVRRLAFDAGSLPKVDDYLKKVRDESYRLTDQDTQRLRELGLSEDEIFELTIAAALGAASRLLRTGLDALAETR
jgi:hypothetical protein